MLAVGIAWVFGIVFTLGAATCDHAGYTSAKECTAHFQNKKVEREAKPSVEYVYPNSRGK